METTPFGIRTNDTIDVEALDLEVLRDLKGGHHCGWCEKFAKRRNCADVRGWAHLNRKCCVRGQCGGI